MTCTVLSDELFWIIIIGELGDYVAPVFAISFAANGAHQIRPNKSGKYFAGNKPEVLGAQRENELWDCAIVIKRLMFRLLKQSISSELSYSKTTICCCTAAVFMAILMFELHLFYLTLYSTKDGKPRLLLGVFSLILVNKSFDVKRNCSYVNWIFESMLLREWKYWKMQFWTRSPSAAQRYHLIVSANKNRLGLEWENSF